jgi:hypothetical protein
MKRIITSLNTGTKNSTAWFMIVFGAVLVDSTLYEEKVIFVPESIYKSVEIGQELTVKA